MRLLRWLWRPWDIIFWSVMIYRWAWLHRARRCLWCGRPYESRELWANKVRCNDCGPGEGHNGS